jgi:hypothetical protein
MKWLRWERPETPPKHPYRDTAVLYAVFAVIIVVVTALTGGNVLPGDTDHTGFRGAIARVGAVVVAVIFFVVATAFSWWRWRAREQQEARRPE